MMYPNQSLLIIWIRRDTAGGAKIVGRYVSPENVLGDVAELVDVSPTRSSGFPKLVLSKSDTILAWTDQSQSTPQVKTARVHMESLR